MEKREIAKMSEPLAEEFRCAFTFEKLYCTALAIVARFQAVALNSRLVSAGE